MNTPKPIDSSIKTLDSKELAERSTADLKIKDPTPEQVKAFLESLEEEDNNNESENK